MQHSWANRGPPASLGGRPVLYPHQKALLDLLDSHLATVDVALRKGSGFPLPLRCILSTPTGSGKTFTAMLLHLQLLRSRHQSVVLLYSVPTKQARGARRRVALRSRPRPLLLVRFAALRRKRLW